MIRSFFLFTFISVLLILASCNSSRTSDQQELPFNPNVEAFTTGKISRYSPVYLVFNNEIAADRISKDRLRKLVRIKPEVEGELYFEDNRTIVFKPAKEFARDTDYRLTADLSEWFDTEGKDNEFSFSFSTFPLALRGNTELIDVNKTNENGLDITCVFFTSDKEAGETVEALVGFSEKVDLSWQHSPDGKRHQVLLSNVPLGASEGRDLQVSVNKNKQGVAEDELLRIEIPGQNDFSVYAVSYISNPERYVEISFTKTLDSSQDMTGLAFIANNGSEVVNISGNKLRLYPDADLLEKGVMNVHINKGIRSKSGLVLDESVVRQVESEERKPNVRFVGKGVIIPQSTQLVVPFQSVYLRGVSVKVIKILERNMGQFLQTASDLADMGNLMQVGRIVALKTIFLDEEGLDLSRWNTFAIDLKQLIEPEPGSIYRLELSFSKELSVYPCADSVTISKEQIMAEDKIKFKEESTRFDNGGYYYYDYNRDWSDYKYQERDDPCSDSYYFSKWQSKNVLATNLGLIAMAGQDKEMIVLAHNLLDTNPEKGVEVNIYNFQHQLLASGQTNEKGQVRLPLTNGKPFYLIASLGKQRSYLKVDDASALPLSLFDVSGEVVQKGIKGFIYGERGIWRPGDTLHLGFMLNDKAGQLPSGHPVVMELYNPLGQIYARKTQTKGEKGIYTFSFATEADAPTGAWSVKANVGGTSFDKRLRIESIKPNRLKINLTLPDRLLKGEAAEGRLHTEWLQGAVARNLKYDVQGTFISTTTSFDGYKGFCFDNPSRVFNTEESKLISGTTDDAGNALVRANLELGSSAPGMLLANFVTRVYEESGDFSIDACRALYSPYQRYAGIKSPQQGKKQLNTGADYTYEVASVNYQGKPQAGTELEVQVYKLYWYWWWDSNTSGLANYMSDSYNKPVKKMTVHTGENGRATFRLSFGNLEWGTYYISVKDKAGQHSTGVMSYFDWPDNEGKRNMDGSESATMLSFKTDKESYAPGEKMTVTFPSAKGGRAIVSIENGVGVVSLTEHECTDKQTTLKLDITKDMQPNAYVHITLLQPHKEVKNDLPIRLYGIVPFAVTSADSHLNPVIQTPEEIKPERDYTISVSERNGREMAYTLAVVDEGLLDLTRFETPQPWKAFNGREALGVNTWDLYNFVVGAYGGRIEQLFSIGGDEALNKGPKAIVNRFKPVVRFEGPFLLKKGAKGRHTYKMPNYNGRVRVMVVAGNGEAYGHAEKSVMVRKPVMLIGSLPRVIGVGEEMVVPATVFATEDGVGNVKVSIACSPNMEVIGEAVRDLMFERKGDKQALFRIRVKERPGAGKVTLTAVGKGEKSVYETELEVRTVRNRQVKVTDVTLEGGKSWKEMVSMPGTEGTNKLTLEVSDVAPINLSSRLSYLLGYPHGCLEQITSKGFPQLYHSSFAELSADQERLAEESVKEVIRRMRSYQTVDGAFSYWPGGTDASSWGTTYATHFLLEAGMKGYLIPERLKNSALSNLSRTARNWKPVSTPYKNSEELGQAYRLYVLALAQLPEMGAMNRLKEEKVLEGATRWMLASAYALVGRDDVAIALAAKTTALKPISPGYDQTFGSETRDEAIRLMTYCLLGKGPEAASLAAGLSKRLSSEDWLSTQSTSFALVALSKYMDKYKTGQSMSLAYTCGGKSGKVETTKNLWSETLLDKTGSSATLELRNTGKSTLFARVITEGIPAQGKEEASANGLSLGVSYVDLKGQTVDVQNLEQGTNFVAVVTIKNPTAHSYDYLVLTEIFPAGWEILNTRYLNNGASDGKTIGVSYQDIRDDRTFSYIDRLPAGQQVTVKVNLCAVYPGRFYLPPVYCEAMYNHTIRANTAGLEVKVR